MPTYDYVCPKCDTSHEVIKYMSESDRIEKCPTCENEMTRDWSNINVQLTGTKIENAEYNPGLGVVTKSKNHREEIARQKGVVEIGNDYKSADHMSAEFTKSREDKLKKSWED